MLIYSRCWLLFRCSLLMCSNRWAPLKQQQQQMAAPGCFIRAVRASGENTNIVEPKFLRISLLSDLFPSSCSFGLVWGLFFMLILLFGWFFFPPYSLLEKRTAEENCIVSSSCICLVGDRKAWYDQLKRWHEVMAQPNSTSRCIKHSTGATSGELNNRWVMQF